MAQSSGNSGLELCSGLCHQCPVMLLWPHKQVPVEALTQCSGVHTQNHCLSQSTCLVWNVFLFSTVCLPGFQEICNTLSCIYTRTLSDIYSGILSGTHYGILSGILFCPLSGICSAFLSGIYSDILSRILIWHSSCYLAKNLAFYLDYILALYLAYFSDILSSIF